MDISSSLNILSKAKMECCGILWLPAAMSSLKKYMFVFLFGHVIVGTGSKPTKFS